MRSTPRARSPIPARFAPWLYRALERTLPAPLGARVVALLRHEGTAGTAAKGSVAAFVAAALGVLVSFAVQVTLTRALGAAGYGTYVVVLVWMNVVLLFTKVELDLVTTRFVGAYAATRDWPRLHGLLRLVPQHVLLRTFIAGTLVGALLLAMRGSRFDHFVIPALAAVPLFVLTAQLLLRAAALQGFKQVLASQVPLLVLRPGAFLAFVWVAMVAGLTLTPGTAIALNVGGTAVALVIAERYVRAATPAEARTTPVQSEMRQWLRVGYGFVWINAAQLTLSQSSDVLLVAALLNRTEAAHYSVASQLALLVAFVSSAVMFIVAPLISELYAQGKLETLRRFTRATVTVCLAVSLTLFLGLALLGSWLLGFFGEEFRVAYGALIVLGASQFVSASVGAIAGWLMTMTGHERPAAWMIGSSAVLNIVLAVPFTLWYGIVGTALATFTATLFRSLVLSVYLRRRFDLLLVPGPLRGAGA